MRLLAAAGAGLLVGLLYFKLFFGDRDGFRLDEENASKMPILDKDYDPVESNWSELKVSIWLMISAGCGVATYHQLPAWFPTWFE